MKKLFTLAIATMLISMAGSAFAVIDWSGNVWPLSGSEHTPTGPINVYVQVYKGGVTDAPGQGADITIDMQVTNSNGDMAVVPLVYNTDIGANDEYTGQVSQGLLLGADYVDVDFVVSDLSDGTVYENPVTDQNGVEAPLRFNVIDVLPNDVAVTFSLCMSGEPFTGAPCVIGSHPAIGEWGTGVNMTQIDGDLHEVTIVFAAGTSPYFEYKFKKDDCSVWEDAPNRPVTLPSDGTTEVTLETQSWNNLPMGCGNEMYLTEDKTVCFQVCMEGVEYTGDVCIIGNLDEFSNWTTGVTMDHLGGGLYQACFVFPEGTLVPVNAEYKFKKDNCETWESVDNRLFVIDDSLDVFNTVTHTWDDGPGTCDPVSTERTEWNSLKASFR